jgi:uncharacterized RDD family membrane protein YckC
MTEQQNPGGEAPADMAGSDMPASAPPPPAEPAPSGGWSSAPPPAPVPGTAGLVYADIPNRAIAYIIDVIILAVINLIVGIVLFAIFGSPTSVSIANGSIGTSVNWLSTIVFAIVGTAISAVYFIYTWTAMRGTIGQKALSMQVGNAPDGKTISQDQAIRRWIFLGGPIGLIQALSPVAGIGALIGLLGLAYFIYLLWTTAQSPTKQGFHDLQASTMVVKSARSV